MKPARDPFQKLSDLMRPTERFGQRLDDLRMYALGVKALGKLLEPENAPSPSPPPSPDPNGPLAIETRRGAATLGLFDGGELTAREAKKVLHVLGGKKRGDQQAAFAKVWQTCIVLQAVQEAAARPWLTNMELAEICAPYCEDCETPDGVKVQLPTDLDRIARFIGKMRQKCDGPIPDRVRRKPA